MKGKSDGERDAHRKEITDARKKASKLGMLEFLDDLPDTPDRSVEVPFPYGATEARPHGWGKTRCDD